MERIERYLQPYIDDGDLSGVVTVAKGERVLFNQAFGFADAERDVPNTVDTRFHIASVTKTFTSAAVALLAERDELALSDPVSRVLPDYPRGDEITVEHLLAFMAGIPDQFGLPGFEATVADGIALRDLVEWTGQYPLEFEPGSQDRYGNSSYALAAFIVEVVSGIRFEQFVRENFLEPLGMKDTGEVDLHDREARIATGYLPGAPPTGVRPAQTRNMQFARGSGSMFSTGADLIRWLRAVDEKEIVDVDASWYPFGWGTAEHGGYRVLEQTGMHDGFHAAVAVVPQADVYVAYASNIQNGRLFQSVHRDLTRIALGMSVEPPGRLEATGFDPVEAAQLAGDYSAGGVLLSVQARPEGLFARSGESNRRDYLRPLDVGRYLLVSDGSVLTFEPIDPGMPASHLLVARPWESEPLILERMP